MMRKVSCGSLFIVMHYYLENKDAHMVSRPTILLEVNERKSLLHLSTHFRVFCEKSGTWSLQMTQVKCGRKKFFYLLSPPDVFRTLIEYEIF
jgi:hypothetical protein